MKKIIVSLVLVVMLFGGGVAHAQLSPQVNPNQTLINELLKKIDLLTQILNLMRQIERLQAQIAATQIQQVGSAPIVNQLTTPVEPIVNHPVVVASSTPQIAATSTPPVVIPAPQKEYNPTIKLEIVGTKVLWQASGEKFNCKLNGESVWQEGSRETGGVTTYNLVCIGNETGTKLEKTIQ